LNNFNGRAYYLKPYKYLFIGLECMPKDKRPGNRLKRDNINELHEDGECENITIRF
jgi:hypothetical protein